ncbi:MAG: transporter substrate-binding domain-containing protein [Thermodesulfobacteriota bacterium]
MSHSLIARRLPLGSWVGAVAVLLLALASPAHAAEQKAGADGAPKPPAELRVGVATNYPPVIFEENGKVVGVEADLARKLGEELPTRITFVQLEWDELWPALRDKKVDVVMSGVSVTERRSNLVAFTDPYLRVGQMALIRKADMVKLSAPEAMSEPGRKVGVEKNTTGEAYARRHLEKATIVSYDSVDLALAGLRGGEVDYFIHDAPTVWRVVGRPPKEDPELIGLYRPLTDEYLAWAIRKEDAGTLGVLLDDKIGQWQKNGELQAVVDRWIPVKKVSR